MTEIDFGREGVGASPSVGDARRRAYRLRERILTFEPPLVLVADDDEEVRRLVSAALQLEGVSVVEARDGADLVELVGACLLFGQLRRDLLPITLVLADVRMPGYGGLEILRGLRDANVDVPIILMTAYLDADVRRQASWFGADALLAKPFDIGELCALVQGMIDPSGTSAAG